MTGKLLLDNHFTLWTVTDLTFLENNYGTMPVSELATILKRTPGAVALMADKLGCRQKRNRPWSEVEMEIIRHHYSQGVEAEELTRLLPGRSVKAIFSRAIILGVQSGRFWREDELRILKEQFEPPRFFWRVLSPEAQAARSLFALEA